MIKNRKGGGRWLSEFIDKFYPKRICIAQVNS